MSDGCGRGIPGATIDGEPLVCIEERDGLHLNRGVRLRASALVDVGNAAQQSVSPTSPNESEEQA